MGNIGDGVCDESILKYIPCNFDGGDCSSCNEFQKIGNSICDGGTYNTDICNYEDGDCDECQRLIDELPSSIDTSNVGDGVCDTLILQLGSPCNYDGEDCSECVKEIGTDVTKIGNGVCDGGEYNTPSCRHDGGDCNVSNEKVANLTDVKKKNIGDGKCHPSIMVIPECNSDGGDCDEGFI